MLNVLRDPPHHLFFTGKGGVGKTSLACATALAMTDIGKSVLLVSTDPASNLDEMLGQKTFECASPIDGAIATTFYKRVCVIVRRGLGFVRCGEYLRYSWP